jgi:hypothetical protein
MQLQVDRVVEKRSCPACLKGRHTHASVRRSGPADPVIQEEGYYSDSGGHTDSEFLTRAGGAFIGGSFVRAVIL